jgi:hypothetical protein
MMLIHVNCTANLGDFCNALPVISGISKYINDPIDLIIRGEMKKFNGIKEFLLYQPCIKSVEFDDDVFFNGAMILSSWTRMDREDPNRPVETCRYENWVNDNYRMMFEVDDDFEILVKPMFIEGLTNRYIVGDRWSHPTIDTRRNIRVVEDGAKPDSSLVTYLDYSNSIMYNLNIIKNNPNPFITTFTGIGIIADLMNKETIVCWDEDMREWDGHPVEFDFERHYYANRKSKLVYVKDLKL